MPLSLPGPVSLPTPPSAHKLLTGRRHAARVATGPRGVSPGDSASCCTPGHTRAPGRRISVPCSPLSSGEVPCRFPHHAFSRSFRSQPRNRPCWTHPCPASATLSPPVSPAPAAVLYVLTACPRASRECGSSDIHCFPADAEFAAGMQCWHRPYLSRTCLCKAECRGHRSSYSVFAELFGWTRPGISKFLFFSCESHTMAIPNTPVPLGLCGCLAAVTLGGDSVRLCT